MPQEQETKPVGVDFFIGELEQIHRLQNRRIDALTKRVDALERAQPSSSFEDDPTKMIAGVIVVMVALQVAMPFLEAWSKRKCQSQ